MKKLLSTVAMAASLFNLGGKANTPSESFSNDLFRNIKGPENICHGPLSSEFIKVEGNGSEKIKILFEGGEGDNDPIVEEGSGMELPQEFFDSEGKIKDFEAFKRYLSQFCKFIGSFENDNSNVYVVVYHNQFIFDFSNLQIDPNNVTKIHFNESLLPGDFWYLTQSDYLWRGLPQGEQDYDIEITSVAPCTGTIKIHWDSTNKTRNVFVHSDRLGDRSFSISPAYTANNYPGDFKISISTLLKDFHQTITPDQLKECEDGDYYVVSNPRHCYGTQNFYISKESVVIGEKWLNKAPSKDVVDAPCDKWIDKRGYKNFYKHITNGVDVRCPNSSQNGTWKHADEVAYCYYVDEDDFNVDQKGNVLAKCCLSFKINGEREDLEYFNSNDYDLDNVRRGDGFPLHVQDVEVNLSSVKSGAKGELDTWLSQKASDQYSDENWGKIEAAIAQGETNIDQATTVEEINTAKEKAIAAAEKVSTIAQKQAVEDLVDQTNQYKNQVNAISTADYSLLITKMDNTTSDNSSNEIAGVIDEVSDAIQNLNTKTQAAKGVIQVAKSFVETHKNDASSEVRAEIAELEEIVNSKESEITTMESQRTTLSEGLVELNNAKIQAENREQAEQNEAERQEEERVQGLVDQTNQYKNQVNAISTTDYSLLLTKMDNTTPDKSSNEIAGVIDEVSDAIQNLNTKTQAAKGVIQAAKSFVETHKNDASEVRAKIAELEEIVNSKESEITTMESQRTTLSEGLVELNNAKTEAKNREQAQQNAAEALEKTRNSAKQYFDKVNAIDDIDIDLPEGLVLAEAMKKLDEALKDANTTSTMLKIAVKECKDAEKKYETAKQQKEDTENLARFEKGVEKIIAMIADEDGKIYGYQDAYGNTVLVKPIDDIELAEMNFSYALDEKNITLYGYNNNKKYPLTMKTIDDPSTPVEEIDLSKIFIVKGNGTENPTIDFDFGMMGKPYIILDAIGRVKQKGEIKDSTMEFGNLGKGNYIFQAEGMQRGKKIMVR